MRNDETIRCARRCVSRVASLSLATSRPSGAEHANFYAGKSIQVVIGFDVGGGYDLYARTVARHWSRHIPGNPTFVPQNMPGAGTRTAGNWLYNVGAEGRHCGRNAWCRVRRWIRRSASPVSGSMPRQFNWIGNPVVDNLVTLSSTASGLATLEDVKAKGGLFCGSTGGGPTTVFPRVINQLLGTQIKVIAGYPARRPLTSRWSATRSIASAVRHGRRSRRRCAPCLMRGRSACWCSGARRPTRRFPNIQKRKVPLIQDYGQNDLDRRVLVFIGSGSRLWTAAAGAARRAAGAGGNPAAVLRSHHERPGLPGGGSEAQHGHQAARRCRVAAHRDRSRAVAARRVGAREGIDWSGAVTHERRDFACAIMPPPTRRARYADICDGARGPVGCRICRLLQYFDGAGVRAGMSYAGKPLKVIVGFPPGGGYDIYARTLAKFLPRHVPGSPSVIVVNMPGAGSLTALQTISSMWRRSDGSEIGSVETFIPFEAFFGGASVRFDPLEILMDRGPELRDDGVRRLACVQGEGRSPTSLAPRPRSAEPAPARRRFRSRG